MLSPWPFNRSLPFVVGLIGLIGVGGCAPVYYPGAVHTSMFEQQGDMAITGSGGTEGIQGDVSIAPVDHLAVRMNGQLAGLGDSDNSYWTAGLGAGYFHAWGKPQPGHPEWGDQAVGGRLAVSVDGGFSRAQGLSNITFSGPSTTSNITIAYSGTGMRASLQIDAGYETPFIATGGAIRPVFYYFSHDELSDAAGSTDNAVFTDVVGFFSAGSPWVKFNVQVGFTVPTYIPDNTNLGLPNPIILSLGLVGNFNVMKRSASSNDPPSTRSPLDGGASMRPYQ